MQACEQSSGCLSASSFQVDAEASRMGRGGGVDCGEWAVKGTAKTAEAVCTTTSGGSTAISAETALLTEDILDLLDEQGISNELVADWATREKKAFGANEKATAEPLPFAMREAVLGFMRHLVTMTGLAEGGWFDAVVLFDLFRLCGRWQSVASLPGACAAIVCTLKKFETGTSRVCPSEFSGEASRLQQWLSRSDCGSSTGAGKAALSEDVLLVADDQAENKMLEAINWQLGLPSVHSWMLMLCQRLRILSRGMLTVAVDRVYVEGLAHAQWLVLRNDTSATMAPRRVANGLLCLGLAIEGVLPFGDLRPADISPNEWEELGHQCQWRNGASPHCRLPSEHCDSMLELIRVTAGCGLEALGEDMCAVARAMQEVASVTAKGKQSVRRNNTTHSTC